MRCNVSWVRSLTCLLCAEAPCSHAVEVARAAVQDAGEAGTTRALREFAAVRDRDAESACHKLFAKYGLSAPVEIDYVNLGDAELAKFPHLRFSNWLRYLLDSDQTRLLCGAEKNEQEELFHEFWQRYEALHPQHDIFSLFRSGNVDAGRCAPAFCHFDEGRTYKSKALLIVSLHGALGKGTRSYQRRMGTKKFHIKRNPMPLNYTGKTWGTQFFLCSLLRSAIATHPNSLNMMLATLATDLEHVATTGVSSTNGREHMWVQVLSCKADLPALTKIGNFTRHFLRVPRRASGRNPCQGICFWCSAGVEVPDPIPFEEYSCTAKWRQTCFVEPAWEVRPLIMGAIPVDRTKEAAFFQTDLWHNWHNGLGRIFVGNAFATFVTTPNLVPGGGIEAKFAWISSDYLEFCARNKISAHLREITRETMGFDSTTAPPQGTWNKAAATTHLMLYLQDFCARFIEGQTDDFILRTIDSCMIALIFCLVLLSCFFLYVFGSLRVTC